MLYGCATWTMRTQDSGSLRTAHHKLLSRVIGFRRKDRTGYKPLSHGEALERTGSEGIETTIRKRQLGFAGALIRQGGSRLSKRIMFGRLAVQGAKRRGQPATSWGDSLQKNSRPSRAKTEDGSGSHSELLSRMDGIGWLLRRTWACGTREERNHSITPGNARTPANPTCGASARLVYLYSSYVCGSVLF